MSYIINNVGAFVNVKMTDTGRRKLASGRLNFVAWAIGDSELNYNREDIVDENSENQSLSGSSRILRPVDMQPNIKYFVTSDGTTALNTLQPNQISTVKAVVNNQAIERGFFSATTANTYVTLTSSDYIISTSTVNNTTISGGTSVVIGTGSTYNIGDLILFKFTNDTIGAVSGYTNDSPIPNLWYKIQSSGTTVDIGDTVTLDRTLPNLS